MGCCFSKTNKVADAVDVVPLPTSIKKPVDEADTTAKSVKSKSNTSLIVKKHAQTLKWKEQVDELNTNAKLAEYCASKTRAQVKDLNELTEFFCKAKQTVAKRDIELAWCIYQWLAKNIKYDGKGFKNGELRYTTPESVLKSGLAVCSGFANLFKHLCEGNELECLVLSGFAKGFGYKAGQSFSGKSPDHAWNAIRLKEKWHYVECTWAAGTLADDYQFNQKFNPYYFLTPVHIFSGDHYSLDHAEKLESILPKFTLSDFERKPRFRVGYYLLDLNCLSHSEQTTAITADSSVVLIEFMSCYKLKVLAKLLDDEQGKLLEDTVLTETDFSDSKEKKYRFIVFLTETGRDFKLELYADLLKDYKSGDSLPIVHELQIKKSANFKAKIDVKVPKYELDFENERNLDLKLISHGSQFIQFDTEVLIMKFVSKCETTGLLANLIDIENKNKQLDKSLTLVQRNFTTRQILVYCSVPSSGKRYKLSVFAKDLNDRLTDQYIQVKDFQVVRTGAFPTGARQLISLYGMKKSEFFIQQPLVSELERGRVYKFSVLLKTSPLRVGFEVNKVWTYFDQDKANGMVWRLEKSFDTVGDLALYVNFDKDGNYEALTKYQVI